MGVTSLQVGAERYNLFTGCPKAKTATMVLRGGSDAFIDEAERSLHDAIMIVRRARKNTQVVAGGGAIDMELSRSLLFHILWRLKALQDELVRAQSECCSFCQDQSLAVIAKPCKRLALASKPAYAHQGSLLNQVRLSHLQIPSALDTL